MLDRGHGCRYLPLRLPWVSVCVWSWTNRCVREIDSAFLFLVGGIVKARTARRSVGTASTTLTQHRRHKRAGIFYLRNSHLTIFCRLFLKHSRSGFHPLVYEMTFLRSWPPSRLCVGRDELMTQSSQSLLVLEAVYVIACGNQVQTYIGATLLLFLSLASPALILTYWVE